MVHVVRCFDDPDIVHVDGVVDPARDMETINLELIFSDMETLERRIEKTKKMMKSDKSLSAAVDAFEKVYAHLSDGKTARCAELDEDEKAIIEEAGLLTMKPVIYAANVSEDEAAGVSPDNEYFKAVCEAAKLEGAEVIPVCAGIEAEIAELDAEEKAEFLADMGIEESGLDKLIKAGYSLLGLISYLTAGVKEVRAWTIKKGTKAPQAAGKIHSDFERGFIRAEVIAFNDLVECGTIANAKAKGLLRSEGKEYVMNDGDVVEFLFNV